MSARNGNALLEAHQLSQHQGARHHRNLARTRFDHFGVVGFDGGGSHHHIDPLHMGRIVAHKGLDPQRLQTLQRGTVRQVRARDAIAEVVQHLGNTTHSRATETHKVDVLNGVFHAAISSHAATMA